MNPLVLLAIGLAVFILASRVYARLLARNLGVDAACLTPARRINDGKDYVPTRTHVLFAHHFSAIAGAGPILGPTMVLLYGYAPAWIWLVCGAVLFGAVHDFTALFVSVREGGRSMAEVARGTLGRASFLMFMLFAIIMLLLVTANFLAATAMSLTSKWPIEKLGLPPDQSLLHTVSGPHGETMGVIGGIASTSVVIITCAAPFLGYALYRRNLRIGTAYALAFFLCIASVVAGIYLPLTLNPRYWMIVLSVYVFFAAALPVWVILQPRDFINVQLLYAGLLMLVLGVLAAGAGGAQLVMPAFQLAEGSARLGPVWPMLFITVACGAISGFHALVAGGTTAKQLLTESDCKRIGYDGMLLEGVLALLVLLALGSTLNAEDYRAIVWPASGGSNPILAFSLGVGRLLNVTFSIPPALGTVFGILLVEGFVITTLDAAVRLLRYLMQELWNGMWGAERVPALLKNAHVNTGAAVLLMCALAFTNSFNALWPLFGTGNQLLAVLTLMIVSSWLLQRGRRAVYTIVPALFMLATSTVSLVLLLGDYVRQRNYILATADVILLLLLAATCGIAGRKMLHSVRGERALSDPLYDEADQKL